MLNTVSLVGRLTKDPELRYTPSGVAVLNVVLAVQRDYRNSQGEVETDFIMVQIWRKDAENTANFMRKGDILGITGRIQTRNYEGQDGNRVYRTDIVANSVKFIHSQNRQNQQGGYGNQGQYQNQYPNQGNQANQYNQQQNNPNYNQGQNPNYNQNQGNAYPNNQGQAQNEEGFNPFNSQQIDIADDDLPF